MSEQNNEGQQYPGAVSQWRELRGEVEAAETPEDKIALAIREGFEGLCFILTQIRFDLKGRAGQ
jgi:acyl CoA:acetate/3-ketoacid CoA transferase alpha subunit